ncbi:MAG: bifunctional folylpolyglutamate synthase/dihydrofolate synthase [Candidatus Omnitrophica bacterium]|nr:bifunctional folylpolyglutamate synthase/dihydrofolate synthase [Candidatus Omnitrophota bacterium]
MDYSEAVRYLESFVNHETGLAYPYKESFKLGRIQEFLQQIGNPHVDLRSIHVAGTKGKGSTCAFITYILREAGFSVGLYTSPHLADCRERIRILSARSCCATCPEFEGMISPEALADLVERLRPTIDTYNRDSSWGPLTFFEIYTALAFLFFKEQNVDWAVLETGLGGRLDATNVVDAFASVITPISYEHSQQLGGTLTAIATEKAGIIKAPGSIVISAPQEEEAREVIRSACQNAQALLWEVGRDIVGERTKTGFCIRGILREYEDLQIPLAGKHQLINAATAVGAVEALSKKGFAIDPGAVKEGIAGTLWPGRCEVVSRHPMVILDGAQNSASARALRETLQEEFSCGKFMLVFGISRDKDIEGVCRELSPCADVVILTRSQNPRAADPQELAGNFSSAKVYITGNIREAKEKLSTLAGDGDTAVVCGSLFVAGEMRQLFQEKACDEARF